MVKRNTIIRLCSKCGKNNEVYLKANGRPIGRCNSCRRLAIVEYKKEYNKKYNQKNSNKRKEHYLTNRDRLVEIGRENARNNKARRAELDRLRKTDPEKKEKLLAYTRKYRKEKYNKDTNFRLSMRLRGRIVDALRSGLKAGSAIDDLGCSIDDLKSYLESKFQKGMNWGNWGVSGWHIDHIKPISSFDLTDRSQFVRACHFTNLQPLWSIDNLKKGNK